MMILRTGRAGLRTFAAAAASMASVSAAYAQAPDALSMIPQGTDAAIVVPNLADFSDKLANLQQTLNLPMPGFDDPLASFKQSVGMTNGLNDDGAMLIVLPDLAEAQAAEREPTFLLLVPVTDYQAFLGNFAAGGGVEAAGDGPTQITLPDGQPGFVKQAGGYAVMGQTQDVVQAYDADAAAAAVSQKIGQLGERYLGDAEAFLFLDLEEAGPALVEAIDREMANMQGVPAMQAQAEAYGEAAKAFFQGATGLVVGLDVADTGVAFTQAFGLKPDSELAGFFPEAQADLAGLDQLPVRPYIFAGSIDMAALDLASLYATMLEGMPQEAAELKQMAQQQWIPLIERVQQASFALYAPGEAAMMSGSLLNSATVLQVDDPQAYIAQLKQAFQALDGVEVPMAPAAEEGGAALTASYTSSYTDNALQIEGVTVDQYRLVTNLPPELMAEMGPAAGMMGMFTNYAGYVAAKDGKVLITTAVDPQLVTNTLQAIDQGGGLGAAGAIGRVRGEALPPNPSAQGYISLGGIAQGANIFLGMMGAPPVQVPDDLPPIALGLGSQGNSVAYRVYLPMDTIKFVVDTAQNLQQQMGGMQQGPGGPPPF